MASEALGSAYVLTDAGARELAQMMAGTSAPVSTPGFTSRRREDGNAAERLSALEKLVRAHSER
jgi:hypothetical protein